MYVVQSNNLKRVCKFLFFKGLQIALYYTITANIIVLQSQQEIFNGK